MILFWRKQQRITSTVSKGCQIEGALFTDGDLQIHGTVRGLVSVNGDIEISETGLVEGSEVRGHNITVQGVVKAPVYAEGKLTLGATARIDGDAIAGIINVDPGAYYTGHLTTYDSRTPFYGEEPAPNTPPSPPATVAATPPNHPAFAHSTQHQPLEKTAAQSPN